MNPEQVRQIIREELETLMKNDRYTFQKNIQIFDARNIQVGQTNGTQFGTATTQKIAFHGATPVVQAGAIGVPAGGTVIDAESRNAIQSIITALKNKGITA